MDADTGCMWVLRCRYVMMQIKDRCESWGAGMWWCRYRIYVGLEVQVDDWRWSWGAVGLEVRVEDECRCWAAGKGLVQVRVEDGCRSREPYSNPPHHLGLLRFCCHLLGLNAQFNLYIKGYAPPELNHHLPLWVGGIKIWHQPCTTKVSKESDSHRSVRSISATCLWVARYFFLEYGRGSFFPCRFFLDVTVYEGRALNPTPYGLQAP